MELGLERMRALLVTLGEPQRAWRAIHVVGSNGKSSTTRYAAALLRAEGVRAGAYLSPHLVRWRERVQVDGEDLPPQVFARAVARVARAEVAGATQFEVLTAAALLALAEARVAWGVVEAGLGGRLDATNVLHAEVVVLTSVALEHTEHLGDTLELIAAEKLAVLDPGATLVTGPLPAEAERAIPAGTRRVQVPAGSDFRATNAAVARAAVAAALGRPPAAAAPVPEVPGRLQVVGRDPLTVLDGAHNPAGAAALAAALPAVTEGRRPLVGVVGVLADKDAEAMLAALRPELDHLVLTRPANPRARAPGELARPGDAVVEEPRAALARARALAGPGGAVLATGSLHLVGDLLAPAGARAVTAY